MKIAIFAYSRQGCCTAAKITALLETDLIQKFTLSRFEAADFEILKSQDPEFYGELFRNMDALIFVGACGIAVRNIAAFVKSKCSDPAVLCVDELGKYVIPILSGHIGGGNDLARKLAGKMNAEAVITTATDINHRFSVDNWAAKNRMIIDDMSIAKKISAQILEKDVKMCADFDLPEYPQGVTAGNQGRLGIYITWSKKKPFDETLRLIPQILHIGIGCRKNTPKEKIKSVVEQVVLEQNIDERAIKYAASIDLKSQEKGLLEFCRKKQWEIQFYSAEELQNVEGSFSRSEFVQKITGVDNVCERAALKNANRLIVPKTARDGVTVAIAAEKVEVNFG